MAHTASLAKALCIPACSTHQHCSRNGHCHCRMPPRPCWICARASIHAARPLARGAGATPKASCNTDAAA
eukprot:3309660-Lingulodinium_polyedra.AAC.1